VTDLSRKISHTGALSCYCRFMIEEAQANQKGLGIKLQIDPQSWQVTEADGSVTTYSGPVCQDLFDSNFGTFSFGKMLSMAYSQLVVLWAVVSRLIMTILVKRIHFKSQTTEMKWIMIAIFTSNVFNYCFVYIFGPYDSHNHNHETLAHFFDGMYSDLNAYWHDDIGQLIVNTMHFNAYYPIIEFVIFGLFRWLARALDQKNFFVNRPDTTRLKTIQAYVEMYSGPEFLFHWKYAYILNVAAVTFIFGPILPVLFPIALMSFVVLLVVERLMLAYSYKRPPMYDSEVNRTTIHILKVLPFCYLFSAAWAYSNPAIFENEITLKKDDSFYPRQGHSLGYSFANLTPGTISACAFLMLLLMVIIWRTCKDWS